MTGVAFSIHCPSSTGQTIQTGRQNLRITFNAQDLGAACLAGNDEDRGFADPEFFGDKLLKRPVGLVLFGHRTDSHFQPDLPGSILDRTVYCVQRRRWRQPNCKFDAILRNLVPAAQKNIGAIDVAIKVRTKKIAISRMIGDISSPPRSGMIRRIGRSAGSVAL